MPEVLKILLHQKWADHSDLVVVHGDCPSGADRHAREFCEELNVPEERYPAEWDKYGKSAGYRRNAVMVNTIPNEALFFIRGESKGTKGCLELARRAGIPYVIYGDRA